MELPRLLINRLHTKIFFCWLILVAFFSITAWFTLSWPTFSSPDETANYAFSQQVRKTGVAAIPTTLAGSPRSVINTGTRLTPGSFVFFPTLIGIWGKLTSNIGMLMLGPILAATSMLCWWFFLKKLFLSSAVSLFSVCTLVTFPVFYFYTSRSFWQNGVFCSLIIISIYLTSLAWNKRYWALSVAAGLLWGITLAIRPSEISWLAPGFLVIFLLHLPRIPWKQIFFALIGLILPLLVLFSLQSQVYGNSQATGYRAQGIFTPAPIVEHLNIIHQIKNVFFPFGTKLDVAWQKFVKFGYSQTTYYLLPATAGIILLLFSKRTSRNAKIFIVGSLVSSFFLMLLYGNYKFIEYPAVTTPVLDHSYLRYWLPIYILGSLGIAGVLNQIFIQKAVGRKISIILGSGIIAVNLTLVITNHEVGLAKTIPRLQESQSVSEWIVNNTLADAYIIAGSRDKFVFPYRFAVGFDGIIPPDLKSLVFPNKVQSFILLSNLSQTQFLQQQNPQILIKNTITGPTGIQLVEIQQRN